MRLGKDFRYEACIDVGIGVTTTGFRMRQSPTVGTTDGQGTVAQQNARAAVHDPFPLNDIGPEVVGGDHAAT